MRRSGVFSQLLFCLIAIAALLLAAACPQQPDDQATTKVTIHFSNIPAGIVSF